MPNLVTTKQIAAVRGVTRAAAWQLVKRAGIPYKQFGRTIAIEREDAQTYLGSEFLEKLDSLSGEGSSNE